MPGAPAAIDARGLRKVYSSYPAPSGEQSGLLLWADKFASAFTPTNNGDQIAFAPKVRLGDLST